MSHKLKTHGKTAKKQKTGRTDLKSKKDTRAAPAPGLTKTERPSKSPVIKLSPAWRLSRMSLRVMRTHWKPLFGIALIYLALQLFLVRTVSGIGDVTLVKQLFDTGLGSFAGGLGGFVLLLGSAGGSGDGSASDAYNFIITAVTSLAIVWMVRQAVAGVGKVRIRDAYYKGMYPLIPVLLVLFVICIEAIPLLMASSLFSTMIVGGVATALLEKIIWIALSIVLVSISLFLLSSSLFAIYIATLPDMAPVAALRTAMRLVKYRRFSVLRKLLFLPVHLLGLLALVIVPLTIFLTPAAPWLFFVLLAPALIYVHAYMYVLYRELLPQ